VALHSFIKGEGKGRGLGTRGENGTPFRFSQPEVMLQAASHGTASMHTGVQLGVPHPLLSCCFYEMDFPSSSASSDWRETIKKAEPKVLSNAKITKLECLCELCIS